MKQLLLLFFIALPFLTGAQEKLNPLKAPTSPASSILGLEPKVILQPKSYQALETALYSNFLNSNYDAVIPTDFALEFTPYWTKNHGLSLSEYLYPESFADQLVRNSSFSIASTQNFVLEDSTNSNGLAFGYRTTFYMPNKKDKEITKNKIEAILQDFDLKLDINLAAEVMVNSGEVTSKEEFIAKMKDTISATVKRYGKYNTQEEYDAIVEAIQVKMTALPTLDINEPDSFLDTFKNIIDEQVKTFVPIAAFKEYLKDRQGLTIDVAFATLLNFPTNSFEFSYLPKTSVWVTPSYRFSDKMDFLKVLGVLRYEWYLDDYYRRYFPGTVTFQNNFDYGASVVSDFKRFSIQFELVGRSKNATIPAGFDIEGNELFRKEKDSDVQYMGTFTYNLTEEIVLSYTLGSRFETILNPSETLVSLLSLNFGFGSPTTADLDLTKK
ncbi:hypothetical protein ATE92_1689 [Ulvibacter sp. MAR_2010_11]|uniref:hypothetical protein n=1 Tax=Ulvibacter sp. MAR_2010_11 TaxID=1250229 RepID=UPI000C2BE0E3|nr:hypothetical protein [Ulvibacter sp. MAR_2010_11]PKA83533.1 hypothetical protein ATE92_1689 [Ulvibacter sp. MAR_2010_11]